MTALTDMVDYEVRGEVALIVIDNPPVNALSHGVRAGMVEGLARAEADEDVAAVLLVCKGRTFIAGADITEFGKPMKEPGLNEAIEAMEQATKPVVAAIHGTALGGGLETAMACHYRVGVSSARFGQLEVKLGILPGAGGTQRLPRLVGYPKALEMCVIGNPIGAAEALEGGLIDEIVDDVFEGGVSFAEKLIAEDRPLRKIRDLDEKVNEARANREEIFDGFRRKIARRTRGFEAPEANVRAIEAGLDMSFDEALDNERKLFAELMAGKQSIAQRYYFFAEREAAKVPDVPRDTPMRKIEKVGVLGCGTMGGGISMNFANRGIGVTIVEAEQSRLDHGFGVIRKNYERTASRGRMTMEQVDDCMGLLNGVTDREALADCDLVIEAVFENMDLKKEIFASLDRIVKPGAILATNTSALDVNEIAAATARPEDVIGMHFFSPANIMRLLEVVRGEKTAKDVIHTSMTISKQIGKVPVLVGVCRGFVGNRILFQRQAQAQQIILEGAKYYDVDRVLYDFGFPMGPFAMSDLAGLDIGWNEKTSASRDIREILCESGRRGQKNGRGYYVYDPETRASAPDPEVEKIISDFGSAQGIEQREVGEEEILERCLYPMVNEGAKILEEGIAIRPSDVDVIWVNGYGWPVYRGGPMHWGDSVGLGKVAARMRQFADESGSPFWQPSPLLAELADAGKSFSDWRAG